MECDDKLPKFRNGKTISIHALTWSATIAKMLRKMAGDISIHALTWSAWIETAYLIL